MEAKYIPTQAPKKFASLSVVEACLVLSYRPISPPTYDRVSMAKQIELN